MNVNNTPATLQLIDLCGVGPATTWRKRRNDWKEERKDSINYELRRWPQEEKSGRKQKGKSWKL